MTRRPGVQEAAVLWMPQLLPGSLQAQDQQGVLIPEPEEKGTPDLRILAWRAPEGNFNLLHPP